MDAALTLPDVAGWTVAGRHGPLGHVVPSDNEDRPSGSTSLIVRGGTSHVLYYHVPVALVTRVALSRRMLQIDADIADFTAHLRPDGSVDLFPAAR